MYPALYAVYGRAGVRGGGARTAARGGCSRFRPGDHDHDDDGDAAAAPMSVPGGSYVRF